MDNIGTRGPARAVVSPSQGGHASDPVRAIEKQKADVAIRQARLEMTAMLLGHQKRNRIGTMSSGLQREQFRQVTPRSAYDTVANVKDVHCRVPLGRYPTSRR